MNISIEIFPTGSNFSADLFYNDSVLEDRLTMISLVNIVIVLCDLPTYVYVTWLIVTGTGNGLAAEFFNLNLAVCEIFICVESILSHLMFKVKILWIFVGFLDGLGITGRPLFQCLICVERYLAVIHPVNFLKYKPLRYRVISSVIFGSSGIIIYFFMFQPMLYFVFLLAEFFVFLSFQLFCLVAVLRALKQSGPGERGREREEENHTKKRAFHLILITNLTLLILYAPYVISVAFFRSTLSDIALSICNVCFTSAGLVQPLLFLYRLRKLPFIKYN